MSRSTLNAALAIAGVLALAACDKMPFGQQGASTIPAVAPASSTAAPAPAPAAAPATAPAPAVTAAPPATGTGASSTASAGVAPAASAPAADPAPTSAAARAQAAPTVVAAAPQAAAVPAPAIAPQPLTSAPPTGGVPVADPEARANVRQGLAYIAAAKASNSRRSFNENVESAINEFSRAIDKDPKYADAYSNRSVAYMQQKKFNKAMDDLRRAVDLAPNSPAIHYNLASLHSLNGNVDLALDEIDLSLTKGFNDYDALRRDPDLNNVRRHPEFRKVLERHKVFVF